jgi:hypothetical protein
MFYAVRNGFLSSHYQYASPPLFFYKASVEFCWFRSVVFLRIWGFPFPTGSSTSNGLKILISRPRQMAWFYCKIAPITNAQLCTVTWTRGRWWESDILIVVIRSEITEARRSSVAISTPSGSRYNLEMTRMCQRQFYRTRPIARATNESNKWSWMLLRVGIIILRAYLFVLRL